MVQWLKTKFVGIRLWESDTRRFKGKPDRCYTIRYKRHGKTITETVGWLSQGITPAFAAQLRGQIVSNIKTGQGFQSLKEKIAIEKARRQEKEAAEEAAEKENTPFSVLARKYLDWAKHNKKSWKDDASRYRMHIVPVLGDVPIKGVSVIHLERLKRGLQKKPAGGSRRKGASLSPQTIKHVLVLVRQIFNWGIGRNLFGGKNPVKETTTVDKKFLKIADNKRVRFLSREEAALLLEALKPKSPLTHDACLLSLYSGMRLGEVFNLRMQDVDLANGIIGIKDPKSGESRNAYIIPNIKTMLERRIKSKSRNQLVFPNNRGGKMRSLSKTFDRTVEALGFNRKITDTRDRVVAHTLRHTFASWLAIDGQPLITIQRLMGHRDISMTLRYAHLSPSHERAAALKIANGEPGKVIELRKKEK